MISPAMNLTEKTLDLTWQFSQTAPSTAKGNQVALTTPNLHLLNPMQMLILHESNIEIGIAIFVEVFLLVLSFHLCISRTMILLDMRASPDLLVCGDLPLLVCQARGFGPRISAFSLTIYQPSACSTGHNGKSYSANRKQRFHRPSKKNV